jgi:hypothetical protein
MATARRSRTVCTMSIILGLLHVAPGIAQIDSQSVAGLWLLDEGTGTIAQDSSGHGYDADLKGSPTWVAGRFGHGLEFSGSNYLEVRNSAQNLHFGATAPFSITAWVKNQGGGTVMGKFNGGVIGAYIFQVGAGGTVSFHREVAPWAFSGAKAVPNNDFGHVAVTYDGAVMKIYVNGEFDAQQDRGAQNTDTVTPVLIGARMTSGAPSEFFHGVLDEVGLFNVALTEEQIRTVMQGMASTEAKNPTPADGATDVPRDTRLTWTAPATTATHNVYFGTSPADVNAAGAAAAAPGVVVGEGLTETIFTPDQALAYGQSYYWRVDEVNGPPDYTVFAGRIWSFTVEPFGYPITGVTATASGSQPGMGPENTVNGSGLDALDGHSAAPTDMWLSNGTKPAWIQFDLGEVYKLHELWVWNSNQSIEPFMGFGAKDVTIEYSSDGAAWTALAGVPEFAQAPGAPGYVANTKVDLGGVMARLVKLTIDANRSSIVAQTGLAEVRFFYVPVQAFGPRPADAAADVGVETELDWRPGRDATSHVVYLGTDRDAVVAGTVTGQTVTEHGYRPADLLLGTQYFWRVDEIAATTYPGVVWSFTTEPYSVVDDFEGYTSEPGGEVFSTWIDGFDNPSKNGAIVGLATAVNGTFCDTTTFHGGGASMPFAYDNAGAPLSEATRTFDPAQDWTARGVKTLTLYFAGADGNSGQLYLKINGTKVPYDGPPADLTSTDWHAWNVDLATVGNVQNVRTLTLGVEGAGAAGTLHFDDIRLAAQTP